MKFNPLSIDEHENFTKVFTEFKSKSDDVESALAKQFNLALDDCKTATQFLKLLVILGTVIFRPMIQEEVFSRFDDLIKFIDDEIDQVKRIAKELAKDIKTTGRYSFMDPAFPASNGNLICIRQLKTRIADPIKYVSLIHLE